MKIILAAFCFLSSLAYAGGSVGGGSGTGKYMMDSFQPVQKRWNSPVRKSEILSKRWQQQKMIPVSENSKRQARSFRG